MSSRTSFITRGRLSAVVVGAVAAAGITAGTAGAAGAQSLKGNITAGGIKVSFDAKRAAGAKAQSATGTFKAKGSPVAAMGLPEEVGSIELNGPITCLETHGQDASFYYPFDTTSTAGALLGNSGSGMIVSLKKESATRYKMGFTPMLSAFVPMVGCDSSVTPLFVTSGGWQTGK
ncbi:hypothetical protein [Patulibacter minatonensis]|uniref:hypothetical protein n=1 Tax=Patulibacter minatonensis TaxID=298163 RepID=UPI00047C7026|nr:hypothetical protein [Patulibacter minatonensis]